MSSNNLDPRNDWPKKEIFSDPQESQGERLSDAAAPPRVGLTSRDEFVSRIVSSRSHTATFALAFILAACSPSEDPANTQAQRAFEEAQIEYQEKNSSGEIDLQMARSLVMMRDHCRLLAKNEEVSPHLREFLRRVYEPFRNEVFANFDRDRGEVDPIGALKDAMFGQLSSALMYNEMYDNMFSPLDPREPRGQCLSCSTLAAILLSDPKMDIRIPEGKVPVFVYTDTHEFLGLYDQANSSLQSHEFTTRASSAPIQWGELTEGTDLPLMRVANIGAVFDGIARDKAPTLLFDNVPANPGDSPGYSNLEHSGREHGQLAGFSSGLVEVPPGDREYPAEPIRTTRSYRNRGGVYQSPSIKEALERSTGSESISLAALREKALSRFNHSDQELLRDLLQDSQQLMELQNRAYRAAALLLKPQGASANTLQEARETLSESRDTIRKYWQRDDIQDLISRADSAWQKLKSQIQREYNAGELVWNPMHPSIAHRNITRWCRQVGL